MHLYVAPTFINLEKPTFWKPNNQQDESGLHRRGGSKPFDNDEKSIDEDPGTMRGMRFDGQEDRDGNSLEKILTFTSASFKYVFRPESESDQQTPLLDINFQLKQVTCEMDGPSMWRFLGIFQATFLDRGEKSDEAQLVEEAMAKDLTQYKPEGLRDKIDNKIKSAMGSNMHNRHRTPVFSKRVSYEIDRCNFKFRNLEETEFAKGDIE